VASRRRGALLLVVWPRLAAWQLAALVAFVATVVLVMGTSGHARPFSHWGELLFWTGYFLLFAFPRPLRFYENGVWYTQAPDSMRTGFVVWDQIDRYRIEGDILILTGTDSTLKGGPVRGGVFHLRPDACIRVEPILAQHLAAKANPG
jgi:hypothetical protein